MSPGPPPPPRLLRDVREGYPRHSGSGGRGQLRPHATRGWPGCRVARPPGLPQGGRGSPSTHLRAHTHARAWPCSLLTACAGRREPPASSLSRLAPTHPDPRRRARPRSPVTKHGRTESNMATPPPPPPHSRRGQGAPSRGGLAPETLLKIARPDYIWFGRIPARPRAPRPAPPRAPCPAPRGVEWRRGGGDRGEPTPLSAARAGGGSRPTAEFSNIACVNHAPRVRQRSAAPGPAPPLQLLNGYNVAAPSFLPRLDWNPRQCRDSVALGWVNFRGILPRSSPHHPV